MPDRKARYADFCQSHYVPMHLQPWWLDAVCSEGRWDVCLATDGGGKILGAMPFYKTRRLGLSVIQQPPLTSYAGPWLNYPQNLKPHKRLDFEKKVLDDLIRQLPRTAFFQQNFHPDVQNWLPFHWAGFRQTTRYTYLFDDLSDLEKIRAGFKNTLRTDLKKAAQAVEILQENDAAELLFQLHEMSFSRKNRRPPYSFETFQRLCSALAERRKATIFIARDKNKSVAHLRGVPHLGVPHAGLCLAFDERRASVLLAGADPTFKSSCAAWALFWKAMEFCSERGLSLDFEGSMERDIERGFRAFGAQLTPYHQIWKAGNKPLEWLIRIVKGC